MEEGETAGGRGEAVERGVGVMSKVGRVHEGVPGYMVGGWRFTFQVPGLRLGGSGLLGYLAHKKHPPNWVTVGP